MYITRVEGIVLKNEVVGAWPRLIDGPPACICVPYRDTPSSYFALACVSEKGNRQKRGGWNNVVAPCTVTRVTGRLLPSRLSIGAGKATSGVRLIAVSDAYICHLAA